MSSITYRIATGAQAGRKVVTLQTLPADASLLEGGAGQVGGFSLHAGVAAEAHESEKLEKLCRYITRPAISEKRLSISPQGRLRYQLKTPWRNGTIHVEWDPVDFIAKLVALVPPPRAHLARFHGIFAPNSSLRAQLTPSGRVSRSRETYEELSSTGNIGLIKDPMIRNVAAELYNSRSIDDLKNEGISSRYRVAFRMAIPIEVQEAKADTCGNRVFAIGDYESLDALLKFDCKTGLTEDVIDQAALILRPNPTFIPLLRLRIVDVKSQLSTVSLNMRPEVRASLLKGEEK